MSDRLEAEREWARKNIIIGRTQRGDYITEEEFQSIYERSESVTVICHVISIGGTVVNWFPSLGHGITPDRKIMTMREYASLRKSRVFPYLISVGLSCDGLLMEMDSFKVTSNLTPA